MLNVGVQRFEDFKDEDFKFSYFNDQFITEFEYQYLTERSDYRNVLKFWRDAVLQLPPWVACPRGDSTVDEAARLLHKAKLDEAISMADRLAKRTLTKKGHLAGDTQELLKRPGCDGSNTIFF